MGILTDGREQVITGVIPPQSAEAMIREAWPSVAAHPLIATAGRILTRTVVLAPLAWFVMGMIYFKKLIPALAALPLVPFYLLQWTTFQPLKFLTVRYTLTNRRMMIRHGFRPVVAKEVALADIDEVTIHKDANSEFFRAATLNVLSKGELVLSLPGVPEPEGFRQAILNACKAWVPGKANAPIIPASAK
jgi:hypothetical protein